MKLDAHLSRAHYTAIVLPLFALAITIHAGCARGPNYYYVLYGASYVTAASGDTTTGSGSCVVYRNRANGSEGYFGPCNDDGDGDGDGADDSRDGP